ncbi:hypothetical protein HanIR_Chr02g0095101 [Helianthus annuus]|nr:hypothetical protein HanIR_Chr02g0095101 [Helianthus annuus]
MRLEVAVSKECEANHSLSIRMHGMHAVLHRHPPCPPSRPPRPPSRPVFHVQFQTVATV